MLEDQPASVRACSVTRTMDPGVRNKVGLLVPVESTLTLAVSRAAHSASKPHRHEREDACVHAFYL